MMSEHRVELVLRVDGDDVETMSLEGRMALLDVERRDDGIVVGAIPSRLRRMATALAAAGHGIPGRAYAGLAHGPGRRRSGLAPS